MLEINNHCIASPYAVRRPQPRGLLLTSDGIIIVGSSGAFDVLSMVTAAGLVGLGIERLVRHPVEK